MFIFRYIYFDQKWISIGYCTCMCTNCGIKIDENKQKEKNAPKIQLILFERKKRKEGANRMELYFFLKYIINFFTVKEEKWETKWGQN